MTTIGSGSRLRSPSGFRVAATSYAKLEDVADRLRPMLPLESRWQIDAWRTLEKTLFPKFKVRILEVPKLKDIAAFTVPEESQIFLREDIYDDLHKGSVFSRSTVVHEVSHNVLNHHLTLHRGRQAGDHKFCEDSEWQAKALTAAVMMPVEACRVARSAQELAEMCGTSVEAATYRLQKLTERGVIQAKHCMDLRSRTGAQNRKPRSAPTPRGSF